MDSVGGTQHLLESLVHAESPHLAQRILPMITVHVLRIQVGTKRTCLKGILGTHDNVSRDVLNQ
ncbi:hypothetical protein D3C81_2216830 [compost metagenome]